MPFYQEDADTLTIDCGKGRSITLVLRGGTMDIAALRLVMHSQNQVSRDQKRIAQFEEQLTKSDLSDAEYDSLTTRIKALEEKPDGMTVLVDHIFKSAKGWTDYFANAEAEKRGEIMVFSKDNIEKMGPGALLK